MSGTGPRRWRLVQASADAVPSSVRRFNQRARKRRLEQAKPWLIAAAVVLLAGVASWLATGTGLLGVREVRVQGVVYLTAPQIRAAAAIRPGSPLATLDLAAISARVQRLPPVRQAVVRRDWPTTVVISVTERTPVAAIALAGGGYRLMDASAVQYRTETVQPLALPLLAVDQPGPGDPSTLAALRVLAALGADLRGQLLRIVAHSPDSITLELTGGRKVIWGDATQNAAKSQAATVLLDRGVGPVIDVSAPDVVTVH